MSIPPVTSAGEFADQLTRLISRTVDASVVFGVMGSSRMTETTRIGPMGPGSSAVGSQFDLIPLVRECDVPDKPRIFLKVEYTVSSAPSDNRLSVVRSSVGLWAQSDPSRQHRPVVRLEYDRAAVTKPAAHVHFHAESAELAWAYGTAGEPLPRFHELHFPMGGRRFRPTLEDLLLFLDRERLFTNWVTPEWKSIIEESRAGWEALQARSTTRRHPKEAAAQLRSMGYRVSEPSR